MTDLDWISFRAAQSYPLADQATGQSLTGNRLPTSFLLDIQLLLPSKYNDNLAGQLYISSLKDQGSSYTVVIAYAGIDCAVCTGIAKNLRATTALSQRTYVISSLTLDAVTLQQYPWMNCITGTLCAGITGDYSGGSLTFDLQGAAINSACIHFLSGQHVQAIQVGDKYLTGVVTLQAGQGISLSVLDNNTINISVDYKALQLIWQQNIADFQANMEGKPVKKINGIGPDSEGNITISGVDCVQWQPLQHGIVLSNPCAKPCCNAEESLADINTSIKILQQEHKTFREYWINMSNMVNYMQASLSTIMNQG